MITETVSIKHDLEQVARDLTSDTATRMLQQALQAERLLPVTAGLLGTSQKKLADRIAAEPAATFDMGRTRGAYARALRMLEQEHKRLARHASVLLVLFSAGIVVTLGLTVVGFARGDSSDYIRALATAVPSTIIRFWYRYVSHKIANIVRDVQTMVTAEISRQP
jgi:hypothetical protein